MPYSIIAHNVSFDFPNGHTLFQNLNFSLGDPITALVGPNGVGKTTLAKLLIGELTPRHGSISRKGEITYLAQREQQPEISAEDYLSSDHIWSITAEKLLSGLDLRAPCSTLSGGQWMKLRLAKRVQDHFLILDEPTNDLDCSGRKVVIEFIRKREGGTLLISHDREILKLCNNVLELSSKGLSQYGGGWDFYEIQKQHERNNLSEALSFAKRERQATIERRHQEIEKQEKRTHRGKKNAERGGMPKILIGARKRRAQVSTGKIDSATFERVSLSVQHFHEALSEVKVDPVMYADLLGEKLPNQKLILETQNFNIRFHSRDWIYRQDLNFILRGNIRLHLRGENGSGKSTLIKALMGERFESRGQLKTGRLKILYVDQKCANLDDSKSIIENIRSTSTLHENEIRNSLAKFLFTKDKVFQKIQSLSGGERLRATLAKGFLSHDKPELLILDEPTNNLDIANIQFLENLLGEFQAALIVISHDEVFVKNCRLSEQLDL